MSRRSPDLAARASIAAKAAGAYPRGKRPVSPQRQADRFWQRVDRSGGLDACWPWMAATRDGYGRCWFDGQDDQSHRVAYRLECGPIPVGQVVRHKVCDNRLCCNPVHMLLGTSLDNNRDAIEKKRHAFGERSGAAKLTAEQVRAIRELYGTGNYTKVSLAAEFMVSDRLIGKIVNGDIWKDIA